MRAPARTAAIGWPGCCVSHFRTVGRLRDVNDADRLCRDPAMRWVVGGPADHRVCRLASQMGRFETKVAEAGPRTSRSRRSARPVDRQRWHARRPPRIVVLDMDSSESPTYGEQDGSAYNGHLAAHC